MARFSACAYVYHCFLVANELLIGDVKGLRLPVIESLLSHDHLDVRTLLGHKVPRVKVGHSEELQKLARPLVSYVVLLALTGAEPRGKGMGSRDSLSLIGAMMALLHMGWLLQSGCIDEKGILRSALRRCEGFCSGSLAFERRSRRPRSLQASPFLPRCDVRLPCIR